MKSEQFFSSHDLQASRSFIVSQSISENKHKFAGPEVPPKVIRKDSMIYNIVFIFTRTADLKAELACKCNLLYADLISSFRIHIF